VLAVALAAEPSAALVTALGANFEVGTRNDVPALTAAARSAGVPMHIDAIAAFGAVPTRFDDSGADLMSVSAVKIGGPAGIGALLASRTAPLTPLLHGGGQERGMRSGTSSPALAIAFAVAAEEAVAAVAAEGERLAALRDRALAGLLAALPDATLRGAPPGPGRLPGSIHVTVGGADGESLLLLLDAAGVSVSTGSACLAGVTRLSPVLLAMGLADEEARGALRITFGHSSTESDVDALLAALPSLVPALRRGPTAR
jgi:cysteine desulfurase